VGRTAKTIGFSVPPEVKKEIDTLAKKEGMTKSELFREMLRAYKQLRREKEFFAIQRKVSSQVRREGLLTEEEIEKIVLEGR